MKKRVLSTLLTLLFITTIFPMTVFAVSDWDGSTATEPAFADGAYQIGTAEELAWFRDYVNQTAGCNANAVLTADIDLGNYSWTPISTQSSATDKYKGIFDGDFHTISGLSVSGTVYQGLFADINGATIKNLMVEGSVSGSNNYIGGIVGSTRNAMIENCFFSGSVTYTGSGSHYIGGLIGGNQTTASTIKNCVNMASVTGYTAGGILGYSTQANTIENCYNTGTITGSNRSGGIVGQVSAGNIKNCYNIGEVSGSSSTPGGIYSFSNATITNCYHLCPETEAPGGSPTGRSHKMDSSDGLLENLASDAFVADTGNINGGYPLLYWQTLPDTTPSISLSGAKLIFVQQGAGDNFATLSLSLKNIDKSDVSDIAWSITKKNGGSATDIATLGAVENDPYSQVVTPKNGGVAAVTVTLTANGETYSKSVDIQVIPHITTAEILSVNTPGAVAIGQTVQAKVYVVGGEEYDFENYPALSYQWKYRPGGGSVSNIAGATDNTFTIPATYNEWDYLHLEVSCGGQVIISGMDVFQSIRSEDYGKLYPVAYDQGFALPTDKKDNTSLILPTSHAVGGITADIEWAASSNPAVIALDGTVTQPESGKAEVTLTAKFTYGGASASRTFVITVWSRSAAAEEASGNEAYLQNAAASLGSFYKLTPIYGTDNNVIDMLLANLLAKGYGDISVAVTTATKVYGNCGISSNGDITYFYADPNGTRGVWFGRYDVTFTLSKDGASCELPAVPVTIHWDADAAKRVMSDEILSGVNESAILGNNESLNSVTSDLNLPKIVDSKKWTLVSWTSSDSGTVFISNENQGTADTLFNPYVCKVIRGAVDKKVTLTAAFTFRRTSSEPAIVLYKVFTVTVKALSGAEADAARAALLEKLEAGFSAKGLRDCITGAPLSQNGDVYLAANDIQFPTTRDFGVDGKNYPITITSSNEDVIVAPDVANAARVSVYRPLAGRSAETVILTVTITDKEKGISASKDFTVEVQPLTQGEIDSALALMTLTKDSYFDGLNKGRYTDAFSVTGGLSSFNEAVWNDSATAVKWIYSSTEMTGNSIIADELPGWAEQEAWRAFRSSNPKILDHETLNLPAKPNEDTFVGVSSVLTHEIFGKYWERFAGEPGYEAFETLYKQPVSAYVMVVGKTHQELPQEALMGLRTLAVARINAPISVSFVLKGPDGTLIDTPVSGLSSGATVFEVFRQVLDQWGYTYSAKGSYVQSVTDTNGITLAEQDSGPNSGWIYRVNGALPGVYMNGFSLEDGDEVIVTFTKDYTKEAGLNPGGSGDGGSPSGTAPSEPVPDTGVPLAGIPFADVAESDWFYEDVGFVCEKGLFNGTSAATFAPNLSMTRAMLVTVLNRMGINNHDTYGVEAEHPRNFNDVPAGTWYTDAVRWAGGAGIVNGIGEGKFGPELSVTRQDLAVMLCRYAEAIGFELPKTRDTAAFADNVQISGYSKDAVTALYRAGIINGKSNNIFDPTGTVTRAEVAAMLHRFMEVVEKAS